MILLMILMAELRKTTPEVGGQLLPHFDSPLEDFWHKPLGHFRTF